MPPNEARYALLYSEYETSPILRLPFEKFSISTVGLPLFAFLFCIFYSVLFHFETATYTHCHVFNVLPSISAAIGNFTPQRQIWQMAIVLHALPRLSIAAMYFQHHMSVLYQHDHWMGAVACTLNVVENVSLIVLSFWTSSGSYPVHEKAFITFIVMSEFYMIMTIVLQGRCKKPHKTSLRWKKRLLVVNISCILIAVYCFLRHNSLCEPYVYTGFAFAEYIVVLTNMGFHMTAYLDFKNKDLVIYRYGVALTER